MADAVHHSLAFGDQGQIEFGNGQAFAVRQGTRQVAALRTDHSGVTAPLKRLVQRGIRRDRGVVLRIQPSGGADHETAGLQGVMPHGDGGLLAEDRPHQRAGELGAVDLLALHHQRVTRKRVVVLPAGQRSDPAQWGGHHRQTGAVPLPPHHPLVISGCDLAALERDLPAAVEQQLGVVQRAAIPFVHPQQHLHAVLTCGRSHRVGDRSGHHHRLVVERQVGAPHANRGLNKREVGVIGQERLREDDQLDALGRRFGHRIEHLLKGSVQAEQDWTDLGSGNFDGGHHEWVRRRLRASRCRG